MPDLPKNRELSLHLAQLGMHVLPAHGKKHALLSECLKRAVKAGVLKPGERLPTELELLAATPFSLGTVQRAVRSLVEEGLVERTPRGTFVVESRRRIDEPWHFRFLDSDRRSLLPVYPTVVSRSLVRQRGPWNDFLHGSILRIDRVVNVNDEYRAYSRFFLDSERFSTLAQAPIDSLHGENFRVMLNTEIQEPITRFAHRLALRAPAAPIARAIGIEEVEVCAVLEIAALVNTNEFIYYQELTVPRSDRLLSLGTPCW